MIDLFAFSLTAGVLAMLGIMAAAEIENWRKRRRMARIQRVERELAQTQRNLEALAMQHQVWLNTQAHDARKALILESFNASRGIRDTATSRARRS